MDTERIALKSITFKLEPALYTKITEAMALERETEISRFIIEAICDKLDDLKIPYPEYVRLKRSRAGIGGPKPMPVKPKNPTKPILKPVSSASTSSREAVVGRILALKNKPIAGPERLPVTDAPIDQISEPIEAARRSSNQNKTPLNPVPGGHGKKVS